MSMTASTLKLPGFTDQPQKTPATIFKENNDVSSKEVGEAQNTMDIERASDIKQIPAHISTVQ